MFDQLLGRRFDLVSRAGSVSGPRSIRAGYSGQILVKFAGRMLVKFAGQMLVKFAGQALGTGSALYQCLKAVWPVFGPHLTRIRPVLAPHETRTWPVLDPFAGGSARGRGLTTPFGF